MSKTEQEILYDDSDELSLRLIEAQYRLKQTRAKPNAKSVLVLVSGIELAGKGEAVKQLREWVDPRYLVVKADPPHFLKPEQPFWQPYSEFIPAEGQLVVLFGNWYSDLLASVMQTSSELDESLFDAYVSAMRAFEQDLKNNHVEVIKVWFDLSWRSLQKRLDELQPTEERWHKLHGLDWRNKKQYDKLQSIRRRFCGDWLEINAEKKKTRDQCFAEYVLQAMLKLETYPTQGIQPWPQAPVPQDLLKPNDKSLKKKKYKKKLKKLTRKVADKLRLDSRRVIILFEGIDAAGKGGAIKRIIKQLDPREYDIFTISAPEKYELAHPYLWRFWTRIQHGSKIMIFDRSWYGRVLVERVDGFASDTEWQRAYNEINRFEENLSASETLVIKFWLAIDQDEQYARFMSRQETPHKRFKLTEDDWHNREKWPDYLDATADMLQRTSPVHAPWKVIATNDKYTARLKVLKSILKRLKAPKMNLS